MTYFPLNHVFSLTLSSSHLTTGLLAGSALAVVATLYLGEGGQSQHFATVRGARSWRYVALSVVVLAALGVVAVATGSAVWLSALSCALAALIISWLFLAPGRTTLSAARVVAGGLVIWWGGLALTLSDGFTDSVRASLGAAALVIPLMAVGSLCPLGGWTTDIRKRLDARAIAPWLFAVLPLLLISVSTLKEALPPELWKLIDKWLMPIALASAMIYALGWIDREGDHYVRMALADYALAFAVICTNSTFGLLAVLLLLSSHLLSGPVLLEERSDEPSVVLRVHWLMMSGIPPTPAFWGRLLAMSAIAAYSQIAFVVAVIICGLHLVGSIGATRKPGELSSEPTSRAIVPWLFAAGAVFVGIFPAQFLSRVFGV